MSSLQAVANVAIADHWDERHGGPPHEEESESRRGTDLVLLWREGLTHDQYQRASTAADFAGLPHVRMEKDPQKMLALLHKAGIDLAAPALGRFRPAELTAPPPPVATCWTGPLPPGMEAREEPLTLFEIPDEELFTLAQLIEQALAGNGHFNKLSVFVGDDGEAVVRLFRRKGAPLPAVAPALVEPPTSKGRRRSAPTPGNQRRAKRASRLPSRRAGTVTASPTGSRPRSHMDPRTSPRAEELHQRRRLHEMSCPSCNELSPPPGLHSRAVPMLMGKCEEGKRLIGSCTRSSGCSTRSWDCRRTPSRRRRPEAAL